MTDHAHNKVDLSARGKASGMLRVQHNKENPYVMIAKDVVNNSALSWEARGMLAYLLGKPDTWQVQVSDLIRQSPAGSGKTARIIDELEAAGHLTRVMTIDKNGRYVWVTTVYEKPIVKPIDGATIDDKPIDGKEADSGEVNTDSSNYQTEPQKALRAGAPRAATASADAATPAPPAAPVLTAGVLSEKVETEPEQAILPIANTRERKSDPPPTLHKTKVTKTPVKGKSNGVESAAVFVALAAVCHVDVGVKRGELNRAGARLRGAAIPVTADELRALYARDGPWYQTFPGNQNGGKPPTIEQVCSTFTQMREALSAQAAAAEAGPQSYGAGRW